MTSLNAAAAVAVRKDDVIVKTRSKTRLNYSKDVLSLDYKIVSVFRVNSHISVQVEILTIDCINFLIAALKVALFERAILLSGGELRILTA